MAIKFLNTVQVDTDVLYVDTANDRVGIGTASPQVPLHIDIGNNNTGILVESSTTFARIQLKDQYGEGSIAALASNLIFSTATNFVEMMRLNGDGNVGIGQSSPTERLTVSQGTDNASIKILSYNNSAGTEATLKFSTAASTHTQVKAAIIARNTAGSFGRSDMHFALNSAADGGNVQFSDTKMTILNGGNVGIGTTSPGQKLEVGGNILATGTLEVSTSLTIQAPSPSSYGNFRAIAGTGGTLISANPASSNTSTISLGFGINGVEKMRINSSGDVGMGTTNLATISAAVTTLSLGSTAASTSGGIAFQANGVVKAYNYVANNYLINQTVAGVGQTFYGAGSEQMRIHNTTGNIGIGTTTPSTDLEVSSSGVNGVDISQSASNASQSGRLFFTTNTASEGFALFNSNGTFQVNSGGIPNNTSGTNRISIIGSSGNVGIGTTSPLFKLDLGVNAVNLNTATNKQIVLNVNGGYTGQTTDQYKVIGYTGSIASNTDIFTQTSGENLKNFYTGVFGGAFFNSSRWGLVQGGSTRFCVLGGTAANGAGNVGIGTTSPGAKLDVAGNIIVSGGVSNENDGVRVTNPGGASFITQSSSIAGAIKITLPQLGKNTMMRMEVKVYEYLTNESFTVQCGGYLTTGNQWYSEYAYIESSAKDDRNFPVRFGYNGSKGVIYIGELSSFWGYPQVFVTEFQGGFQNPTALNYQDGWDVGFETTSFSAVTRTQTGTQVNNWARSGSNIYFASSTGNVGIGTTNPNVKLEIGGGSTLARVIPAINNQGYIGDSQHRWQAIYATNGTIQTSDIREKTEIKPTKLGLDFINDLTPVSYKWTEGERLDASKDERNHQGLIAQEVAETLEKHGVDKNKFGGLDIQKTDEYDDFHAMSYEQLIAPMIKAIQELKTEIEELKKQINK